MAARAIDGLEGGLATTVVEKEGQKRPSSGDWMELLGDGRRNGSQTGKEVSVLFPKGM